MTLLGWIAAVGGSVAAVAALASAWLSYRGQRVSIVGTVDYTSWGNQTDPKAQTAATVYASVGAPFQPTSIVDQRFELDESCAEFTAVDSKTRKRRGPPYGMGLASGETSVFQLRFEAEARLSLEGRSGVIILRPLRGRELYLPVAFGEESKAHHDQPPPACLP